jgi:hypothetical protein
MANYFRKAFYSLIKIYRYFKLKIPLPRDLIELLSYIKSLFIFNISKRTRVLGIIDFNLFNFALGDLTIFHENLFILREKNNQAPIDICIVEDLNHKKNPTYKKNNWVTETLQLNPHIENVFQFNKRTQYNKFRINNLHNYVFFPKRRDQLHCDHRPLFKYYYENGSLPQMSVDKASLKWAQNIIQNFVGEKKLIVVQIRNSMGIKNPEDFPNRIKGKKGAVMRDSNLPEWQKFFEKLDKNKFKVICVCTKYEIVTTWQEKELVLFSKDLGADLMKDLALVQCSYLSLFPTSGLHEFSFYSRTPCCIFNPPLEYWRKKSDPIYQINGGENDFKQNCYQSDFQKFIWEEKDDYNTISYNFNQLVEKLEKNKYDKKYNKKIINL